MTVASDRLHTRQTRDACGLIERRGDWAVVRCMDTGVIDNGAVAVARSTRLGLGLSLQAHMGLVTQYAITDRESDQRRGLSARRYGYVLLCASL